LNQSGEGRPNALRIWASQPVLPVEEPCHTIVLATSGIRTGMKNRVLNTGLPASSFWLSRQRQAERETDGQRDRHQPYLTVTPATHRRHRR